MLIFVRRLATCERRESAAARINRNVSMRLVRQTPSSRATANMDSKYYI